MVRVFFYEIRIRIANQANVCEYVVGNVVIDLNIYSFHFRLLQFSQHGSIYMHRTHKWLQVLSVSLNGSFSANVAEATA